MLYVSTTFFKVENVTINIQNHKWWEYITAYVSVCLCL